MKYLLTFIFTFLRSGFGVKRGVEFEALSHTTYNVCGIYVQREADFYLNIVESCKIKPEINLRHYIIICKDDKINNY